MKKRKIITKIRIRSSRRKRGRQKKEKERDEEIRKKAGDATTPSYERANLIL